MDTLHKRIHHEMQRQGMLQNDLYSDPKDSSKISQLVNGKIKDPRLSTVLMVANALGVSLDYLAGRTDNPMGFCNEELDGLRIDAEARALLRGFDLLPPEGRRSVSEQVELQLLKSQQAEADSLSRKAMEGVA